MNLIGGSHIGLARSAGCIQVIPIGFIEKQIEQITAIFY
jgi:hypothetical protein